MHVKTDEPNRPHSIQFVVMKLMHIPNKNQLIEKLVLLMLEIYLDTAGDVFSHGAWPISLLPSFSNPLHPLHYQPLSIPFLSSTFPSKYVWGNEKRTLEYQWLWDTS